MCQSYMTLADLSCCLGGKISTKIHNVVEGASESRQLDERRSPMVMSIMVIRCGFESWRLANALVPFLAI
uniref:Uncharacterized protein n=1 Tax=Parascaris equorum TaxID=6256 RepID=A0A914S9A0_PAREQ